MNNLKNGENIKLWQNKMRIVNMEETVFDRIQYVNSFNIKDFSFLLGEVRGRNRVIAEIKISNDGKFAFVCNLHIGIYYKGMF